MHGPATGLPRRTGPWCRPGPAGDRREEAGPV